ncbi:hypothetical protein JCM12298_25410 [Desulfothermus naphthae]
MSNRIVEMYIFDIFVAIKKIKETIKGFNDGKELLYSYKDWDSVIREFEIIGEATKHLLKHNLIDKNYRKIVDFRNLITHSYFGIDEQKVFEIAKYDLNDFEKVIMTLINNMEPGLKNELINAYIEDNKYLDFIVNEIKNLVK